MGGGKVGRKVGQAHGRGVGQAVLDVVFVGVDRLFVLTEVVEAREVFRAVRAGEGPLARVFAAVARQVFGAGEGLAAVGEARALENAALQWLFRVLVGHARNECDESMKDGGDEGWMDADD